MAAFAGQFDWTLVPYAIDKADLRLRPPLLARLARRAMKSSLGKGKEGNENVRYSVSDHSDALRVRPLMSRPVTVSLL